MTQAESDHWPLPLKTTEEVVEVSACLAAAEEISEDAAAAAAASSELDGFLTLKDKRTALKAFLRGKDVCTLHLTDFGKGFS